MMGKPSLALRHRILLKLAMKSTKIAGKVAILFILADGWRIIV
jgi:hypothetical protein